MVVNGRPLKRIKKRTTADLHDFLTFPAAGDEIVGVFDGSFRSNVRSFLSRHARLPSPSSILSPAAVSPHLLTWRVAFRVGDSEGADSAEAAVELNVVEEDVPRSRSVYCDQCRVVGWGGHPVCGKRYHFIIRNAGNATPGYQHTCTRCGTWLHSLDLGCTTCNCEMTADDPEDWAYLQLEDTTHLLHGVVHANGYGHLLRVNGREGGSKVISGSDIMGFWDRLCKMLHVRKVTVMDVSKKYGLEYRLLHAVTVGHPWYGNWGYEFGAGSFAVTAEAYQKAVNTLSTTPLSLFFSHARSPRTQLQDIISFYWSLSDRQLETVRDLFCFVTRLLHDAHEQVQAEISARKKPVESTSTVLCAWTREDVERAENAMIKVLRAVDRSRWVTWRALRGATCQAVGSAELLDYCLKGLGGKTTDDDMVVAVRCNAETSATEYRLDVISKDLSRGPSMCTPSADHLLHDLKFLYNALLNPPTMESYKPKATQESALSAASKLLDCKQFIKHYDQSTHKMLSNPYMLQIWCHAELVDTENPNDSTSPPQELLVLPITATIADLKHEATKAFQETYLIFQKFQAEQLLGYRDVNDSTQIKLLLGLNGTARVRGRCFGAGRRLGQFRMERGTENWTVDCPCGAKDDDGERMLACDTCGVWQHTRCAGINDFDEVPGEFICTKCVSFCKPTSRGRGRKSSGHSTSGKRCREAAAAASCITEVGSCGSLTSVG